MLRYKTLIEANNVWLYLCNQYVTYMINREVELTDWYEAGVKFYTELLDKET